jgi:serine O-acetyltransferase
LHALRRYQYWKVRRLPILAALLRRRWVVSARFWAAVSGADIPLNTAIGGGLALPHPNGIVIHPDVTLGVNCLIFQQVTLGQGGKKPGVPTVGGHVDIGAGAKILGGVTIGDHARIGANAVVLDDVPAGATAVGVPARILGVPATLPEGIPDARA